MVPRGLGLAFLGCFEELDRELCEPQIRAFMEEQVDSVRSMVWLVLTLSFTGDQDSHW